MSLAVYNNLKKTIFNEAVEFFMTKYELAKKGEEEKVMKELWEDFKKYETKKGENKVPKKKAEVPEEERCTHIKADGTRCTMKKVSEKVLKAHPEYNPEFCATKNRVLLSPKKTTTAVVKKFVCGHVKRDKTLCGTKVAKEGDKCKVYDNMMKNKALKAQASDNEATPTKTTPIKKHEPEHEEEEDDAETEEIEATNEDSGAESEDEELPPTKSAKKSATKKRVVEESDDEEN